MAGEKDGVTPVAMRKLCTALPARYGSSRRRAHLNMDQPRAFTEVLRDFLRPA
jgi:hypothetical protein